MVIDNIHQLLNWEPPQRESVIEEGILLPETRMMIFGQAKAWKSMLSLHTAFILADGLEWFGFKTTKTATFKYQIELPKAIDKERVQKYARSAQSYPQNIFFKTPTERVKLDTTWGRDSLTKDIQEIKKRCPDYHLVVILDPLYKLMSGHISDPNDVLKFQDNVDEVRAKEHVSFIIIHHSRLTRVDTSGGIIDLGSEEAMGSSYWNNWCDTMIRVKLLNPYAGADRVEMSFELTRNAHTILPKFFIHWSRATLQPKITKQTKEYEDISIKDGGEE